MCILHQIHMETITIKNIIISKKETTLLIGMKKLFVI